MSIDVFGRKLRGGKTSGERGPPGVGFKLTNEGHDMENKRLCNVAWPQQPNEVVNLALFNYNFRNQRNDINEDIEKKYRELKSYIDELNKSVDELKNLRKSTFDSIDYFRNMIGNFKGEIYQEIKNIKEKLGIEEKKPDTLVATPYRHKKVVNEKRV